MSNELRYKRQFLRYLLIKRIDPFGGTRKNVGSVLDKIYNQGLTDTERAAVRPWMVKMRELFDEGLPVRPLDEWERASGLVVCDTCGLQLYDHPVDPRQQHTIAERLDLHVRCDGTRWKL